MINIVFQGRVKNRRRYEDFACNVLNEIFPREFKREIEIHVRFARNIGAMGWCVKEDDDVIAIEIDAAEEPEIIARTLAHELTHAKQYIRGELNATMTRWMRQDIPYGPRGGIKIGYHQQPWEKEAFEAEKWLTEMYW